MLSIGSGVKLAAATSQALWHLSCLHVKLGVPLFSGNHEGHW